jgi:hypothetical protein
VLKFATSNHLPCCEKLVEVSGLKHIFPILMGWGLPKSLNHKKHKSSSSSGGGSSSTTSAVSLREVEETVISIIAQLVSLLHDSQTHDASARLLCKLTEKEGEKLDRCAELAAKYGAYLRGAEQRLETMVAELEVNESWQLPLIIDVL